MNQFIKGFSFYFNTGNLGALLGVIGLIFFIGLVGCGLAGIFCYVIESGGGE